MKKVILTATVFLLSLPAIAHDASPFAKILSCYNSLPEWIKNNGGQFHEPLSHAFARQTGKPRDIFMEGDKHGVKGLYYFSSDGSYFQPYQNSEVGIPNAGPGDVASGRCVAQVLPGSSFESFEVKLTSTVKQLATQDYSSWSQSGDGSQHDCENTLDSGQKPLTVVR